MVRIIIVIIVSVNILISQLGKLRNRLSDGYNAMKLIWGVFVVYSKFYTLQPDTLLPLTCTFS